MSPRDSPSTPAGKTQEIDLADLIVDEMNVRVDAETSTRPFPEADEKIDDLAQSIAKDGLLFPLVVRPSKVTPGKFTIIAGSRRFRSLKELQRKSAKCSVLDVDDLQAISISIDENLKRGDVTARELARSIRRLGQQLGGDVDADKKIRKEIAIRLNWKNLKQKPDTARVLEVLRMGTFQDYMPGLVVKYRQRGEARDPARPVVAWGAAKSAMEGLAKSPAWQFIQEKPREEREQIVERFMLAYRSLPTTHRKQFLAKYSTNPRVVPNPEDVAASILQTTRATKVVSFRADSALLGQIESYVESTGMSRNDAVKQLVVLGLKSVGMTENQPLPRSIENDDNEDERDLKS
jgi:ParB/RepB/Spo0J family partition protein